MTKGLAVLLCGMALVGFSPAHGQVERCMEGDKAAQSDNFAAAVEHYTACLDKARLTTTSKAHALLNRALAYSELKQWRQALEDQKAGLALEAPRNVWPLVMLSVYHRELKEYEPALAALRAAMSLDEDGPGTGPGMAVHYHRGQTLHAMGRYREAIEEYTRGIPKQPDYGYALYRRALAYEALGDREMAKRDLFRAAQLEPRYGYDAEVAAKLKEYGFTVRKVRSERLN